MPNTEYHSYGTMKSPDRCKVKECREENPNAEIKTFIEHGGWTKLSYEVLECTACGHTWKEEWY